MDRHLNCFFSYNFANELVENNLTRALIVTLMGLTPSSRRCFFASQNEVLSKLNFSNPQFALQQGFSALNKDWKQKWLITLGDDTWIADQDAFSSLSDSKIEFTLKNKRPPEDITATEFSLLQSLCSGSIPDAVIYDNEGEYALLIEVKKQGDPNYFAQILRHAYASYGIVSPDLVIKSTIRLTWQSVIRGFTSILQIDGAENDQEEFLINNFLDFLGFFGYRQFGGFNFKGLANSPRFGFGRKLILRFSSIVSRPDFKLLHAKQ